MGLIENIHLALEGLRLNKMRSFLTMLGIIIGISSVIAIVTIGRSMGRTVNQGLDSFGSQHIMVTIHAKEPYSFTDLTSEDGMSVQQINMVKEHFPKRIKSVVINGASAAGKIKKGRKSVQVQVFSTSPGTADVFTLKMLSGRFLTDQDIRERKEVAVISDKVVEKIYDGDEQQALGSLINVDTHSSTNAFTVIGVYKYEPINFGFLGSQGADAPTSFYIPYSVGNSKYSSNDEDNEHFKYFGFISDQRKDTTELSKDLENFMNDKFYANNERCETKADTMESQLNQVNSIMSTIQMAIGGIAAISLLVGGIGVMNILLVTVTERTKEIGIRKALGATNGDIRAQFITESVIICIIGGIFGIILGAVGGYLASKALKEPTLPSISSIVVAVGFSMVIGIFFGYYPASKAAQMDPIDALRYE